MACGVVPVTTPINGVSEIFPVDWLCADTVSGMAGVVLRALEAGDELKARCRSAAVDLPRGRAYAGVEEVLLQVAESDAS